MFKMDLQCKRGIIKSIVMLSLAILLSLPCNSAIVPENVQNFVNQQFPDTNFRFDGTVILSDNTVYLPLMPAKIIESENIEVKQIFPNGKLLSDKPDVIIFNNDYVLLKVLSNDKGESTLYAFDELPIEVRTGLLPQDLLTPKDFVVPENMKSIIGNLQVQASTPSIKIDNLKPVVTQLSGSTLRTLSQLPPLKNKNFYVTSPYSKNIQVLNLGAKTPEYSLSQNNVPISMKAYNDEFMLVTSYDKPSVDVISLADDQVIKQISIKTQPDEILIDKVKNIAYVSSAIDSSIYVINLENMTLSKQIKIMGMCEKLTLSDDGSKIFYYDKRTRDIWAIELDNNYLLKEIGKFPNVSKILFVNNKIYVTSRTKNRLAIIDYNTVGLIAEIEVCEKPVDMVEFHDRIYILGAGDNSIFVLNSKTDELTESIYLNTNGFSTRISHIDDTNIALITDTKASLYTVFDLGTNKVIKTVPIDIPANSIVVTKKVEKINDK